MGGRREGRQAGDHETRENGGRLKREVDRGFPDLIHKPELLSERLERWLRPNVEEEKKEKEGGGRQGKGKLS